MRDLVLSRVDLSFANTALHIDEFLVKFIKSQNAVPCA